MKTEPESKKKEYLDKIKKYYVTEIKGFDPNKMAVATILYEGGRNEVKY